MKSFAYSFALHVGLLLLLVISFNFSKPKPTILINLQKNASIHNNTVKAGLLHANKQAKAVVSQESAASVKKSEIVKTKDVEKNSKVEKKQDLVASAKNNKKPEKVKASSSSLQKNEPKKQVQADNKEKKTSEKPIESTISTNQKQSNVDSSKQAAGIKSDRDALHAKEDIFFSNEIERYKSEFATLITDNRTLSAVFAADLNCTIRIKLLPDGSVLSAIVQKSSGNLAYDEMSKSAVYKAEPFPMPENNDLYVKLSDIVLSFRNGGLENDDY